MIAKYIWLYSCTVDVYQINTYSFLLINWFLTPSQKFADFSSMRILHLVLAAGSFLAYTYPNLHIVAAILPPKWRKTQFPKIKTIIIQSMKTTKKLYLIPHCVTRFWTHISQQEINLFIDHLHLHWPTLNRSIF